MHLRNVSVAKDLCALIDSDLKFFSHIDVIVTKAHERASLILRCFKCTDKDLLFQAFVTYVRRLLEFKCQVWSSSYSMQVNIIKRVQRKFTKSNLI